jgi:hypothetical protein
MHIRKLLVSAGVVIMCTALLLCLAWAAYQVAIWAW